MYYYELDTQIQYLYYDLHKAQLTKEWETVDDILKEIIYLESRENNIKKNKQRNYVNDKNKTAGALEVYL